jgi:hypothetical protein
MVTASPTPTPTLDASPPLINYVLSPVAIAAIAISAAITIAILALLCCCCCCRRHSSKRSQDPELSFVSRFQSSTPTSQLGLVQEPVSMMEMGDMGRGFVGEEPPPAYTTLEHRNQLPVPVEIGAETRRGQEPEIGEGMEAWNGFQIDSSVSPGMNPRTETGEALPAGPAAGRNMSLRVDIDVNHVVFSKGESAGEDE